MTFSTSRLQYFSERSLILYYNCGRYIVEVYEVVRGDWAEERDVVMREHLARVMGTRTQVS